MELRAKNHIDWAFLFLGIVIPTRSKDPHFIISILETRERNLGSLFYNLAKLGVSLEKKKRQNGWHADLAQNGTSIFLIAFLCLLNSSLTKFFRRYNLAGVHYCAQPDSPSYLFSGQSLI